MKIKLKKRNLGKKGGRTITSVLVSVIILIIAGGILLFLIGKESFVDTIDRTTCHESIMYRHTFKAGPLESARIISLQCKTKIFCFTMSGDDCKGLKGTKENPIRKIKLSKDVTKAKKEIIDTIAESMVDCHSMLGEGMLNFMPHKTEETNYGLICSNLFFDWESKEKIKSIGHGEIYANLEKKQASEGKSYLEYLYPGWKSSENYIKLFEKFKETSSDEEFKKLKPKDWKMDLSLDNGYAIISQLATKGAWDSYLKAAGVAGTVITLSAGTALIASGIGAPAGVILIVGGTTASVGSLALGGATLWYTYPGDDPDKDFQYSPPVIYPFDLETLKNMKVYSFEIAP